MAKEESTTVVKVIYVMKLVKRPTGLIKKVVMMKVKVMKLMKVKVEKRKVKVERRIDNSDNTVELTHRILLTGMKRIIQKIKITEMF